MYNHLLANYHPPPLWPLVLPPDLSYTLPLATVFSEPALYTLLIFYVPRVVPIFRYISRSTASVQIPGPVWHFIASWNFTVRSYTLLSQSPSWITSCQLSATAYAIHSQLPSIDGGRLLHPQHENSPCRGPSAINASPKAVVPTADAWHALRKEMFNFFTACWHAPWDIPACCLSFRINFGGLASNFTTP
jgi:hypothetical protein